MSPHNAHVFIYTMRIRQSRLNRGQSVTCCGCGEEPRHKEQVATTGGMGNPVYCMTCATAEGIVSGAGT